MKFRSIFFFAVLYVLFMVPASLIGQEGLAGPDRYICPGGTTSIGNADLCRKCCIVWSPTTGLSDPGSMHTQVNGIMNTTQYILHYTTADGDLIADTVMVFVNTLDITLHKPAFIDPNEAAIPAAQALQQGAQTMVNLDDDDGDLIQDDGDMDVKNTPFSVFGDNEFIKIKITLRNSASATGPAFVTGSLNHELGSNSASVKFWKSKDKVQGMYTPGDTLHLLKVDSVSYSGWLWIEGVSPHTMQQEVRFRVSFSDPAGVGSCISSPVGITVIGIQQITWSGNGNGYSGGDGRNNSNTLDFKNGSYRVFPEAKMSATAMAPTPYSRDSAILHIMYTVAPVDSIPLAIRLIDIDDPSSSPQIDPNDHITADGLYVPTDTFNNMKFYYTMESDNRDERDNNKLKAGALFGAKLVGPKANGRYLYFSTSQSQQFYLSVSAHPGDNYKVAAYGDFPFINNIYNIDHYHAGLVVITNINNPSQYMTLDQSLISPTLTCWRTLHVEYDLMLNPNKSDNQISGFFSDFESVNHPPYKFTQVRRVLATTPKLSDNSLPSNPRFKYGEFKIGNPAVNLCIAPSYCVTYNGANDITFSGVQDLTLSAHLQVELTSTSGIVKKYNINEIEKLISPSSGFQVTISPTPSTNELFGFQSGNASVGGGKACVGCVQVVGTDKFIIGNNSNNMSNLNIPFILHDDDDIPDIGYSTRIKPISVQLGKTIYEEAYIDLCNDGGGRSNNSTTIPFIKNINNEQTFPTDPNSGAAPEIIYNQNSGSAQYEKNNYWVSYILSAWQHSTAFDFDADNEISFIGITTGLYNDCGLAPGGEISILFHEQAREAQMFSLDETLAHEIGHQLGLSHGTNNLVNNQCNTCIMPANTCPNMGLMCAGLTAIPNYFFIDFHQNIIRCRVASPGKK